METTVDQFSSVLRDANQLLEQTDQVQLHITDKALVRLEQADLPKEKTLINVETHPTQEVRILAGTDQIIATQKMFLARSGPYTETLSWNIMGLGDLLDRQPEGAYVLSPAFELNDGSVYTLKFTLFSKRGSEQRLSTLAVAAVPNQQEQTAESMNRHCARITVRTFRAQKGQPAKIAAQNSKAVVGRNFSLENPVVLMPLGELSEQRVRANDLKRLLTVEIEFRAHVNYLNCERRPYAGLVNEGTTCYLNSVMQALFMCKPFRRAAYELKVDPDETKDVKLCI